MAHTHPMAEWVAGGDQGWWWVAVAPVVWPQAAVDGDTQQRAITRGYGTHTTARARLQPSRETNVARHNA